MTIRLLVADDHEAIRLGLASILAGSNIEIVAQAASGKECLKLADEQKPDVIVLDVRMPNGDGLETLEKLRKKAPESKVVMFSTHENPSYIARAVASGASDYLLKSSQRKAVIEVIQAAAAGKSPSASGELARIAETLSNREPVEDQKTKLTPREAQIVRHLAFGLSNKEIGRSLEISVETVKEHVQNILRKFEMKDRCQIAVWAVRKRLV